MDAFIEAAELVRSRDKDRYLADLFAPEAARKHLFALHAFNVEIASVRDKVSEPLPGEVRLQWWRDAIASGEGQGNPLAEALIETIARFRLPAEAFDRMIEARIFDLYDDPIGSLNELEGYAGDTASALIQLGALVLLDGNAAPTAEAAGHAGVALALTGILASLPIHSARRQVFLPLDRLAALGAKLDDYYARRVTPELAAVFAELRAKAREHLALAVSELGQLPPEVLPAFAPIALIPPMLKRLDRAKEPLTRVEEVPQWRRQWHLWRFGRRFPSGSARSRSIVGT